MAAKNQLFEALKESKDKNGTDSSNPPDWVSILSSFSGMRGASYVDEETGWTPLHLAVMAKSVTTTTTTNQAVRLQVIRSLVEAAPETMSMRCHEKGYTPLMYACVFHEGDEGWEMFLETQAPVAMILLDADKESGRLRTAHDGYSAVDLHILSMSRLQRQANRSWTTAKSAIVKPAYSAILKALMDYDLRLPIPRSLDLLFSCNCTHVMKLLSTPKGEEANRLIQDSWIWEFVVCMLRSEHDHTYRTVKPVPPFNALHTACQIVDFPVSFLILATRVYPHQLHSPTVGSRDLPLDMVKSWDIAQSENKHSMECRKRMVVSHLGYLSTRSCLGLPI